MTNPDQARVAAMWADATTAATAEADRLSGRDIAAKALADATDEHRRTGAEHLTAKQAVYALAEATPNGPTIVFPDATGIARFAFDPTKGKPEDWRKAVAAERAAQAAFDAAQRTFDLAARNWRDFHPDDPETVVAALEASLADHLDKLIDSAADLLGHLAAIEQIGNRIGVPSTVDGANVYTAIVNALPATTANVRTALVLRDQRRDAIAAARLAAGVSK